MIDRMRALALLLAVAVGCGTTATVTAPGGGGPDGGSDPDDGGATGSGETLPSGEDAGTPVDAEAGAGPGCLADKDCNEDPAVSALWGTCFRGICVCKPGFHVQPSGRCSPKLPADCRQSGGACKQEPASCAPGAIEGSDPTNMSCGDLIAAVCCFARCKGPEFVCCGPTGVQPVVCESGWRTCTNGDRATTACR